MSITSYMYFELKYKKLTESFSDHRQYESVQGLQGGLVRVLVVLDRLATVTFSWCWWEYGELTSDPPQH